MRYVIKPSQLAVDDLDELRAWVETQAGYDRAATYIGRVVKVMNGLTAFPHRGTPRDAIGPGIRSIVFERRLVILYRVEGENAVILRVVDGSRDLPSLLMDS